MSPVTVVTVAPLKRVRPHVDAVADWAAQQSLALVWDRLFSLQEQLTAAQATITILVAANNTNETAITRAQRTAQDAMALAQRPGQAATSVGGPAEPALPGGGDGGAAAEGFAAAGPTGHDSGGVLSAVRAGQIVGGTANEFSGLLAPATEAQRATNQLELLLRMIWHLRTAGFSAGRQRNPSGAISSDKLTVVVDGVLRAYDVFTGPPPSEPLVAHMIEVAPPVMIDDPGTPD